MEDKPKWKMSFNGRRPSMTDNLGWNTTFRQTTATRKFTVTYNYKTRLKQKTKLINEGLPKLEFDTNTKYCFCFVTLPTSDYTVLCNKS